LDGDIGADRTTDGGWLSNCRSSLSGRNRNGPGDNGTGAASTFLRTWRLCAERRLLSVDDDTLAIVRKRFARERRINSS
jgi:hypothetical protein